MSIGFIGAGNMATAIIKGYLKNATTDILVYDICEEKADALAALGVQKESGIPQLAQKVKYLFLAIKPQNFEQVLSQLKGNVKEDTVIVSIAAGITSDYLKKELGFDAKVVLVMPNTPLMLGYGATALSKVSPTTEEEFFFCCEIFKSSGEIAVISPEKMNEIIPINGSSPAFIYQYAKYFIEYGVSQGFDYQLALNLFAQALIGSAHMMTDSGHTLDELIQMVSSKGGTTLEGLQALKDHHLDEAVQDACQRCVKRAYELSK